MHAANDLAALEIAVVGHRAGVDHAHIGGFGIAGIRESDSLQALANQFGFVLIDFAA